jgi:hypothetical protein
MTRFAWQVSSCMVLVILNSRAVVPKLNELQNMTYSIWELMIAISSIVKIFLSDVEFESNWIGQISII